MVGVCMKDFSVGYVYDFVIQVMVLLVCEIKEKNIKVISNVGGVNLCVC